MRCTAAAPPGHGKDILPSLCVYPRARINAICIPHIAAFPGRRRVPNRARAWLSSSSRSDRSSRLRHASHPPLRERQCRFTVELTHRRRPAAPTTTSINVSGVSPFPSPPLPRNGSRGGPAGKSSTLTRRGSRQSDPRDGAGAHEDLPAGADPPQHEGEVSIRSLPANAAELNSIQVRGRAPAAPSRA